MPRKSTAIWSMYHCHFRTPTTSSTIENTNSESVTTCLMSQAAVLMSRASTASRSASMSRTGLTAGFFFTFRAYRITYAIITAVPDHPGDEAVAEARVERDAGDALGDADGERIEERRREPGRRAEERDRHADDGVVAELPRERDEDDDERNDFFGHAEDRSRQREDGHQRRDQEHLEVRALRDGVRELLNTELDRARLLEDGEAAADHQQEADEERAVHEPLDGRLQDHLRAEIDLLDLRVRAGDGHKPRALARADADTLVLARRDQPRRGEHDDDERHHHDERVRHGQAGVERFRGHPRGSASKVPRARWTPSFISHRPFAITPRTCEAWRGRGGPRRRRRLPRAVPSPRA